jgi:polyvinyl alcohol dehydrogenase (cytochrome)
VIFRLFAWLYLGAALLLGLVGWRGRELRPGVAGAPVLAEPFCSAGAEFNRPFDRAYWNGWGAGVANRRSQTLELAGLDAATVGSLHLKWAFGVPGVTGMFGQPTVVGGRVFFGTKRGDVSSLDAESGCIHWVFEAGVNVRSAITIGAIGGRWAAYFGDHGSKQARAYAVDAANGDLIWKTELDPSPYSRVTGAPVLAAGRLYVPVTGDEDAFAGEPRFECCRFQGSLVALDAETGKLLWKSYTIAYPARPTSRNANGTQQWGPSGAGIWSRLR